nr:hypothetical protein HK105_000178 [Polyrhizophydium stewartii]
MIDCQSDACHAVLNHVVPSIGVVTVLLISVAPLSAVREADRIKSLGTLNPFPFPMLAANSLSWVVYSFISRDPYVFAANIMAAQFAYYYTLTAYKYADESFRMIVQVAQTASSILIFGGAAAAFIGLNSAEPAKTVMGCVCIAALVVFYSAPLSTFRDVIKARDSSSISFPLTIATLVNSGLWAVYGFVIGDAFIYGPNALGVVLAIIQVGLMVAFPKKLQAVGEPKVVVLAEV